MNNKDILVIADTQVDSNSPLEHLHALSKYIITHKPAHIIHIGDHWDFPSLSSYASTQEKEGKRLIDDLRGGYKALDAINGQITLHNLKAKAFKKAQYKPNLQFIMGNHENRLDRMISDMPFLDGIVDLRGWIENRGWVVNEFLDPLWIDDICFVHYMSNPMSGRPVGGGIENKLNKFPHSFVHGHQQQFQMGRRQNLKGLPHFGVCAGSFYMHNEGYRGSNNTEIRGFVHLKAFENRYKFQDHDVEFVSLERLLKEYK